MFKKLRHLSHKGIFNTLKTRALGMTLVVSALGFGPVAHAQFSNTLVSQDFSTPGQSAYKDLSLLLNWGGLGTSQTAFNIAPKADNNGLSYSAIALTDSAVKYSRYLLPNGLKTSQCIDFPFGPISRSAGDSLEVEFSVIWDVLTAGGEGGRVVAALMHEIPDYDNLPFGVVDSVQLEAPFGRPAYNFRILNRRFQGQNNYAHLFYGGGKDRNGEFEKLVSPTNNWWLPGFISMPSGLSPGTRPLYPEGPGSSYGPTALASTTEWIKVRMVLRPEHMRVEVGPVNGTATKLYETFYPRLDADTNVTIGRLNAHYGTAINRLPQLYQHWDTLRGLRLFWSGAENAYLSNIKVNYSGTVLSTGKPKAALPLTVFPNPGQGQVTISAPEALVSVSCINSIGQQVMAQHTERLNSMVLNLETLPKGMYWISALASTGQRYQQRYVKN